MRVCTMAGESCSRTSLARAAPAAVPGDWRPAAKLPQQPLPQGFRQRSAVPLPQLLELLGKVPVDFDCQATTSEQALNPIGLTSGLTLECEQLAVQLASVFFRGRGNLAHAPELCLSADVAELHAEQLLHV